MDIRYQRGKIYTIRCHNDDTKIYVGSTVETLSTRLAKHRCDSKQDKFQNRMLYQNVNKVWTNWYIELYENYPCNSKEELLKKEGEVIRQIGTLNKVIAGRTKQKYHYDNREVLFEQQKKYRADNRNKFLEKHKKYYENNKKILAEKGKEQIICECGCQSSKKHISRHQKTKKHENLMEQKLIV